MNEARPNKSLSIGSIVTITILAALATAFALYLLTDIFDKKQEAKLPFARVVEIDDDTSDPAIWGQNFPYQYDTFMRTVDLERTRFGGSETLPQDPSKDDPRTAVSPSKLEHIPQLKRMWNGYAFAVDYREKRGHAYMLEDQIYTQRTQVVQQPGTCLNCHASTYNPWKELGDGDPHAGYKKANQLPFDEAQKHYTQSIACIDCHDAQTMALRITRPGFIEGIKALKAKEGIADYDPNTMASRQEMRSFVCAQCHVEYYFSKEEKDLVFPWHEGLKAEEMLEHFDKTGFSDWTHKETGAQMVKVQHPEFELWSMGTHAAAGVSCSDCHMPYTRVGAMKITDHQARSPLLNINNACQTCHKVPEQELIARTEAIQVRTQDMRGKALDALVDLIDDIKAAKEQNADLDLSEAQEFQRQASFYVDFVVSDNSNGFHAPQEAVRILGTSVDCSRKGQNAVRDALRKVAAAIPAEGALGGSKVQLADER